MDQVNPVTGKKDASPRKEGFWKELDSQDRLVAEGYYVDGRKSGLWTYYFNGKVDSRVYYVDGERSGFAISYYNNGIPRQKSYYLNDVRNGPLSRYNEEGVLGLEEHYVNGHREGYAKYYNYHAGGISSEGNYFNDKQVGLWRIYHDNKLTVIDLYVGGEKFNFRLYLLRQK